MFYLLLLLIKDGEGTNGERLRETPHPSRGALDTFSRLGEGSHSREFCKNHLTLLLQQSTHKASPWGKLANEMSLIR